MIRAVASLSLWLLVLSTIPAARSQGQNISFSKEEKLLVSKIRGLSEAPYEGRGPIAKGLALEIRRLPSSLNKLRLADALAFLSSAGDLGKDNLQQIATTLAECLQKYPAELPPAYENLARLVNYESVEVFLTDPLFAAALSRFTADDQHRREVDFTLADLSGKVWHLKELHGKPVLVLFWNTWSRPCWAEMKYLEELNQRFKKAGLVILAIAGESRERVSNYVKTQKITFRTLPDPEQKVAQIYRVIGVPKTFVYDREGKLVAQAIDMRTGEQLLNMLNRAGLE